ncbi:5'-3' exoribonuclease 1-like [Schistocerca gregaria]|uniref:5'-3' exoribonuclease 1-like n=1 Tax=Schistocerca gregaria TaxID=7010 RepID=UPI00211E05F7|nr:5'-3' exoribonuclease 1-like [Schistocerca gregaria]XP_049851330.1 5'-3' exoribonuclease 1-like [Schistocerca gregaria]
MGIKGFTKYFMRQFPKSMRVIHQGRNIIEYDHVLVDLNQIVHRAIRSADSYQRLWKKLYSLLNGILKIVKVRRTVLLVADGIASKSKFVEQRRRRVKDGFLKKQYVIDRAGLLPGCNFTYDLEQALCWFVCQRLQHCDSYRNVKFCISGPTIEGEGELKIIKYIQSIGKVNDFFLIVGSDADLILLGLSAGFENISILTTATSEMLKDVRLLRPDAPDQKTYYVEARGTEVLSQFRSMFPRCNPMDISIEFVLMSILMGNDYLPPSADYKRLWAYYVATRNNFTRCLVDLNGCICLKMFLKLLSHGYKAFLPNMKPVQYDLTFKRFVEMKNEILSGARPASEKLLKALQTTGEAPPPDSSQNSTTTVGEDQADNCFIDNGSYEDDISISNCTNPDEEIDTVDSLAQLAANEVQPYYDEIEHASQYIFGLEWVIKCYLEGDIIENDWFFPYSRSPHYSAIEKLVKNYPSRIRHPKMKKNQKMYPFMFAMTLSFPSSYPYIAQVLRPILSKCLPTFNMYWSKKLIYVDTTDLLSYLKKISFYQFTEEEKKYSFPGKIHVYEYTRQVSHNALIPKSPLDDGYIRPPYHLKYQSYEPDDFLDYLKGQGVGDNLKMKFMGLHAEGCIESILSSMNNKMNYRLVYERNLPSSNKNRAICYDKKVCHRKRKGECNVTENGRQRFDEEGLISKPDFLVIIREPRQIGNGK